jgi:hypothetical protein
MRHGEPRHDVLRGVVRRLLQLQLHHAVGRAVAKSGQCIDHAAQPRHTPQRIVPAIRIVAVHVCEQGIGIVAHRVFHLRRERERLGHAPLRQQARVNQEFAVFRILPGKAAAAQPVEQAAPITGAEHVVQRVTAFCVTLRAMRAREQVEIVIAEHDDGIVAQRLDEAQYAQGVRAAIDEIADEPELVPIRVELQAVEQCAQFGCAALHVTDGVARHLA